MASIALCAGDIADLSLDTIDGQVVAIKVPHSARDNDLMQAERNVLAKLHKELAGNIWVQCLPKVQAVPDNSLTINRLEYFPGFLTVEAIKQLQPAVDARTLVWMWKRLLGVLTWVHHVRHVHGALLPPHVLYYPDNNHRLGKDIRKHAVRVVDWCYSVNFEQQTKLNAWVSRYRDFYPPEVFTKMRLGPPTDLYMVAKLMVYLIGGDVASNAMPSSAVLPARLRGILLASLDQQYTSRSSYAADVLAAVTKAAEQEFGEPKYHEFRLAGI